VVQPTYADDADDCRQLADEVEADAEKAILYAIANEFDRLANLARWTDRTYYAARASQELTAAVNARNPKARLAHLVLARRYDAIAQTAPNAALKQTHAS